MEIQEDANTITEIQEDANDDSLSIDENGKVNFKKIFKSRKKPSERAKNKKLRQNRRLRRSLFPKNALMALNEVKGITISEFICKLNDTGGFTATCSVNGKQHVGKGSSKNSAKNQACESALREFVLTKMKKRPRLAKNKLTKSENSEKPESQDESMDVAEIDENSNTDSTTVDEDDDDLPMANIASFALFKLFSEWERNGYIVPEMHAANENMAKLTAKEPKKPPIRNELPDNWQSMHPSTLLCIMRPGLNYTEYGGSGEKPNIIQRVGVVVDGREFIENGRSKKLARRNVAVAVCNTLFGTNFPVDEKTEIEKAENEKAEIEKLN